MKPKLIGTIAVKSTGNWVANLYVRQEGFKGEYVAQRIIGGYPPMEWKADRLQHLLDSVERWMDVGELIAQPLKSNVTG